MRSYCPPNFGEGDLSMSGLSSLLGCAFWMSCENSCKFGTLWDLDDCQSYILRRETVISGKNRKKRMSSLSLLHLCSSTWSWMPPPDPAGKGGQRCIVPWRWWDWAEQLAEGEMEPWLSLAWALWEQGARDHERRHKAGRLREECWCFGSGGNRGMGPGLTRAEMDPKESSASAFLCCQQIPVKAISKVRVLFLALPTLEWLNLQL